MGTYNLGYVKGADGQSGTWEEVTLTNSSGSYKLYVNTTLRLCELKMLYMPSGSMAAGQHTSNVSVPETYQNNSIRPQFSGAVGGITGKDNAFGVLRVSTGGAIAWYLSESSSANNYIQGSVMWHY